MRFTVLQLLLILPLLSGCVQTRAFAEKETLPGCTRYGKPRIVRRIPHLLLAESSGIVASRKYPDILYTHNDSGNDPVLIAIRTDGTPIATCFLRGAGNIDWEDIAIGPSPSGTGNSLYIGDVGNNSLNRKTITLYVLPEPDLPAEPQSQLIILHCTPIQLQYPGRPFDCEAIAVHPLSGSIYLVTKASLLEQPQIFRADPPFQSPSPLPLAPVAQLPLRGDPTVTAIDIHPSGTRLLVRTYRHAYEFIAPSPEQFEAQLQNAPRSIPTIGITGQSEAICYSADGNSIYFTAEGRPMPLYHLPCQNAQ